MISSGEIDPCPACGIRKVGHKLEGVECLKKQLSDAKLQLAEASTMLFRQATTIAEMNSKLDSWSPIERVGNDRHTTAVR